MMVFERCHDFFWDVLNPGLTAFKVQHHGKSYILIGRFTDEGSEFVPTNFSQITPEGTMVAISGHQFRRNPTLVTMLEAKLKASFKIDTVATL